MDRPAFRDGGVVFDGPTILAVGSTKQLRRDFPDAQVTDAGNSIILPGLINAHTHLELSHHSPIPIPSGGFVEWIKDLILRARADEADLPRIVAEATVAGIEQCLRFGVTTIGDISKQCHLSRPILRNSPLRAVSYGEVQAMGQRRSLLEQRLAHALDPTFASDRLKIGLSPHAPYSIEITGYRRCVKIACARNIPLATHLAETPHESDFLATQTGPFRDLWTFLRSWDADVPRFADGPIRMAQQIGLLDCGALLAHVNYCSDEEMNVLAEGSASVVYCPRTHAYFGHPPHRWRDMLLRGINVAVGTDSCASSPDLNLVDDLRLMHKIAPEIPPRMLWEMATINSARSLQLQESLGTISPGKCADFTIFPTASLDPLMSVLDSQMLPRQVWIDGSLVNAVTR